MLTKFLCRRLHCISEGKTTVVLPVTTTLLFSLVVATAVVVVVIVVGVIYSVSAVEACVIYSLSHFQAQDASRRGNDAHARNQTQTSYILSSVALGLVVAFWLIVIITSAVRQQ